MRCQHQQGSTTLQALPRSGGRCPRSTAVEQPATLCAARRWKKHHVTSALLLQGRCRFGKDGSRGRPRACSPARSQWHRKVSKRRASVYGSSSSACSSSFARTPASALSTCASGVWPSSSGLGAGAAPPPSLLPALSCGQGITNDEPCDDALGQGLQTSRHALRCSKYGASG